MYEGKKVRLRAYGAGDIDDVLRQINDYESVRNSATGVLFPNTYDDEVRWLNQQTAFTRGEYQFAIETLAGDYVGGCGFNRVDCKNRCADIGILIGDASKRGRGYGSDAIRVLCRVGFAEMNLHKLRLDVLAFNTSAVRCYEACGFVLEGRMREAVFREDAYHDSLAMGLLRREWRANTDHAAGIT